MSATISIRPTLTAAESSRRTLSGRLRGVVALLALWAARQRQRRELGELDERLLRDIGVTRAAALREADKPFWRA